VEVRSGFSCGATLAVSAKQRGFGGGAIAFCWRRGRSLFVGEEGDRLWGDVRSVLGGWRLALGRGAIGFWEIEIGFGRGAIPPHQIQLGQLAIANSVNFNLKS